MAAQTAKPLALGSARLGKAVMAELMSRYGVKGPADVTAPVGTANAYAPVSVNFASGSGTLTGSTSDGDHASIASATSINSRSSTCATSNNII